MTEQELARLGSRILRWDSRKVEAELRRLHRGAEDASRADGAPPRRFAGMTARMTVFTLTASAAALVVVVAMVAVGPWRASQSPPAGRAAPPPTTTLVLDDGSDVNFQQGSDVAITERGPTAVVVALRAGAAGFRVRHDVRRVFRVQAGPVQIEDLGTAFRVRRDGARVFVAVSEGRVAISFPAAASGELARVELGAGESGTYPPEPPPAERGGAAADGAGDGERAGARAADEPPPAGRHPESWRRLARERRYDQAFRALLRAGLRSVQDEPTDLLLAADVARLSRHPEAALAPLRAVVERHSGDARAPAAAFALGWVLMNDLRRPREGAAAFATAERLAPRGNLAEDAAARTAEAWYGAGDLARASSEVARYAKTYPQGRHRALLERLVGVP